MGGLLEDFTIEDIGMFVEGVVMRGAGVVIRGAGVVIRGAEVETGIGVGGLSPSCGSEEGTT